MGWEKRGNNTYYYRKRREGGHVVSEYVGRGESAQLIAQLEEAYADRDETGRQMERIRREEAEAFDRQLDQVGRLIGGLMEATLLANGFHKHRGEWRRVRREKAADE